MGPEEVLNLFDSCWFTLEIFKKKSQTSNSETSPHQKHQKKRLEPVELSSLPTILLRSKSDQFSSIKSFTSNYSVSPNSVLFTPTKGHGILYSQNSLHDSRLACFESPPSSSYGWDIGGHEISETWDQGNFVEGQNPMNSRSMRRRRKKKGITKSFSDLEFEELKGFMDLGFVFSEEDVNSSLVEIIPGLQILGKKEHGKSEKEETCSGKSSVQRPYLSEAWEVLDTRKTENPFMNWRIPDLGNEIRMKDSLKLWAQTVASTVR